MKKLTLLLICIVGGYTAAHAQTIDDFVSEVRGDTLVVNTYAEHDYVENALSDLIAMDTLAPDSRVYELKHGGYYPVTYQIAVTGNRPLVIEGQDDTPHVSSTNEVNPPMIYGVNGANPNIAWNTDITLRNLIAGPHNPDGAGAQGWSFSDAAATGISYTLDNVYMEHTFWIFIQSNGWAGNSVHVKNSYFVNMNGNGCRRNGGVYDNTANNTKEMIVENSTHVMGAGMLYKFRTFPISKAIFNHNTFVNISNAPISTSGYQTDLIVTNNLFVNTNVQAYYPYLDGNETDQDGLPTGIINVDSLNSVNGIAVADTFFTDKFANADPSEWSNLREILVDGNAVYWSPTFDAEFINEIETMHANYLDTVAGGPEDGELIAQNIKMNSRTKAMFDNDSEWPLLTEGVWYEGDPGFTEDFGLLGGEPFDNFVEYTKKSLDNGNALALASMRTDTNSAAENFPYPDWPIPVDLSYSNAEFKTGARGGLPVGDLNWFPSIKATYDRDAEIAAIEAAQAAGETIVSSELERNEQPKSIKLQQNYPNPFNPTTNISFEMPKAQEVTLKVYDMLGREVATLMNNEFATSGVNSVTFDAANLASGIYIYRLQGENFSYSKSMTLMK